MPLPLRLIRKYELRRRHGRGTGEAWGSSAPPPPGALEPWAAASFADVMLGSLVADAAVGEPGGLGSGGASAQHSVPSVAGSPRASPGTAAPLDAPAAAPFFSLSLEPRAAWPPARTAPAAEPLGAAPPALPGASDVLEASLVGDRSRLNPVYRLIRMKDLQRRQGRLGACQAGAPHTLTGGHVSVAPEQQRDSRRVRARGHALDTSAQPTELAQPGSSTGFEEAARTGAAAAHAGAAGAAAGAAPAAAAQQGPAVAPSERQQRLAELRVRLGRRRGAAQECAGGFSAL
jgi:hypothetical protein